MSTYPTVKITHLSGPTEMRTKTMVGELLQWPWINKRVLIFGAPLEKQSNVRALYLAPVTEIKLLPSQNGAHLETQDGSTYLLAPFEEDGNNDCRKSN